MTNIFLSSHGMAPGHNRCAAQQRGLTADPHAVTAPASLLQGTELPRNSSSVALPLPSEIRRAGSSEAGRVSSLFHFPVIPAF